MRSNESFNWLKKPIFFTTVLLLAFLLGACGGPLATEVPLPANQFPATNVTHQRVYNAIWDKIREHYVFSEISGVELEALYREYQSTAVSASGKEDFGRVIDEMFQALPAGSIEWMSRDERIAEAVGSTSLSSYEGIGAFIAFRPDPEPHVVLLSIIAGSPAEEAGLLARDSIYAIDGLPILSDEDAASIAEQVRGPAGSTITLSIRSPGQPQRDVIITRGPVVASDRRLDASFVGESNILYLAVPRTGYPDLDSDTLAALETHSEIRAIGGIIIDLRIAANGNGWPLVTLLSLFTQGQVGTSYSLESIDPIEIPGQDFFNSQSLPIAILVGPDTQGFPEIFAAGMQANARALVYGLPTSGNIEVSQAFAMPDGSQLSLATISFIDSIGNEIGIRGVQPNVVIESYWEDFPFDQDTVMDAALRSLLASSG